MTLKLGIQHCVHKLYKIYINDDHGSTMTYFMARSNLIAYAFEWGKTVTKSFNEKILYCLHCALDEGGYPQPWLLQEANLSKSCLTVDPL